MSLLLCVVAVTLYSASQHLKSSLYTSVLTVPWAFMADATSQAGDSDSSRAPDLTFGFQGSMDAQCAWYSIVSATVTAHHFFRILHLG